ncbi:methyltransferase domain-containing protein, partial [Klebsiella pneumoniae]|uniref:methyltransferase domain-containing protein n=1 Tax=Klebsiella pneumoniae TaxID=573 RepID=UPI001BE0622A
NRWVVSDRLPDPKAQPGDAAGTAEGGPVAEGPRPVPHALVCDYDALPFEPSSLDLVVLPHTLELSRDPHHTLREVERVLVPEG